MMKRKKVIVIFLIVILVLLFACYSLFQISKSRTYQFFGEIVHRVDTDEKVVALTFDDGPTEYTADVLNTLKEKDVKATFFVMGRDLEDNLQVGKDIVSQGHELGNHTYSHQRMYLKSPAFIASEIENTNKLIRDTGYKEEIHFRPPYGKKLFGLPWYLSKNNIKTIMWDVEPDSYGNSANFIVNYAIENVKPGSIILLHPFCKSCNGQREAISEIIERLHTEGYKFVTVSELLTLEEK